MTLRDFQGPCNTHLRTFYRNPLSDMWKLFRGSWKWSTTVQAVWVVWGWLLKILAQLFVSLRDAFREPQHCKNTSDRNMIYLIRCCFWDVEESSGERAPQGPRDVRQLLRFLKWAEHFVFFDVIVFFISLWPQTMVVHIAAAPRWQQILKHEWNDETWAGSRRSDTVHLQQHFLSFISHFHLQASEDKAAIH